MPKKLPKGDEGREGLLPVSSQQLAVRETALPAETDSHVILCFSSKKYREVVNLFFPPPFRKKAEKNVFEVEPKPN